MIKSIVKKKESVIEYPCIKISDRNLVVFFSKAKTGIALKNGDNTTYKIGYFSNGWDECVFRPFSGTVTLSNENSQKEDLPMK